MKLKHVLYVVLCFIFGFLAYYFGNDAVRGFIADFKRETRKK